MAVKVFPSVNNIGTQGDTLRESSLVALHKLLIRTPCVLPGPNYSIQFINVSCQFTFKGILIAHGYVFDFGQDTGHTTPPIPIPGDLAGLYYVAWVNDYNANGLCTGFHFAWNYQTSYFPGVVAAPFATINQSSSGSRSLSFYMAYHKSTVTAPWW